MSEQYTPTTDEVRLKFAYEERPANGTSPALIKAFDRWLDQVKAEAFDEGWKARAERDPLAMNIRDHSAPPPPHGLNPYRNGEDRHVDQ